MQNWVRLEEGRDLEQPDALPHKLFLVMKQSSNFGVGFKCSSSIPLISYGQRVPMSHITSPASNFRSLWYIHKTWLTVLKLS